MDSWVFKELGITPDVNLLDDLYEYELACPEGVHEEEEEETDTEADEEGADEENTNPPAGRNRKH